MAVTGEARSAVSRKVGVSIFEVVDICPTAERVKELFNLDEVAEKEPEYVTDKDQEVPDHVDAGGEIVKVTKTIKQCRLDIYLKDTKTNNVVKHVIFLNNRFFVKKDMTKQQFINDLGKTAWVDDEANLPQKFTHIIDVNGNVGDKIGYHAALMGEADLIDFLDTWLTLDKKRAYELSVDTSKLFKGNFKELQGLIKSELASLMMGTYIVRGVDGDQGLQFYQGVWKKFLPAFVIKFFQTNKFTPERLKEITDKALVLKNKIDTKQQIAKTDWISNWEKYALDITDNDYGCKDSFSLEPAHDFDPEKHYATQAATIDQTGAEY